MTGSLDAGLEGRGIFKGSLAACREHDLAHEVHSGAEINERFPGFTLPSHHRGLLQPEGGFIACERAIIAHVALAQAGGAEIDARERVLGWDRLPGGGVRLSPSREHR